MLRWGILGTGFISHKVIQAIKDSDQSVVKMIAGRNDEAVAKFQSQYDIPKTSTGYQMMLEDPDIDVVYIGLPNHVHHTATIDAAKAGKAILSEKSLTTTMEQAHDLIDAVQRHQVFFVEGFMYLAHPLYQKLAEILADGRLGNLRAVNGYYAADIWQVTNPLGKGTLYNLGCYPVSLLHFVVQSMCGQDVFATGQLTGFGNVSDHDGTICDAAVSVRFDNGVLANLQSTDSYGMAHEFSISGENGVLRFVTNPWLPVAGRNHLQWCPYGGEIEDIHVTSKQDGFYHQIKMVEEAVSAGRRQAERPSPRWQDSMEIMKFLTDWEAQCLGHQP